MIKNQRQYELTKEQSTSFSKSLLEARAQVTHCRDDEVWKAANIAGMESILETLNAELLEFEELTSGKFTPIVIKSLEHLPEALIKARLAARLTQKELADRLGLRQQQIQRWEACDYEKATLPSLIDVACCLNLTIEIKVSISS